MKRIISILISVVLLSSCVSNKQLTYFQGDPVPKNEIYRLNNAPYRLQVNDILYIDIKADNAEIVSMFKASEAQASSSNQSGSLYFTGYTIDRHGNIRMPFIGDINVLGYTEKETREKVETELGKFFKNPELIFVTVKLGGINFLVTGEVGSPGTVSLMQNQVSIIDALANAGEITTVGNRKEVEVIRKTLDGVKKFKIDMTDMSVFNSENFYIQPNDIIYVPPLKQKAWGTGTTGLQTFTTVVTVLSFLTSSILLIKNL
ncbi:polysaccharide biosynthesis/export family protein [Lutibacter sp. TH_r2]|uniref:polysaccharide biosynthesis/export family protein n=1 Tax=Lutibacter sp. TH_r2 TaxID=3082083 RepID=UPI0029547841|nr:polysaccharide biosynthesis/export family protein [Lutibacter sp. TH_r2]MDV7188404.1 polysaccharide biosynthesis/export family protein [Lutibacter sp. TH_r2]